MDFLKRKVSRLGHQLCHFKVVVKPKGLEIVIDSTGDVWVQFKRGRHKETTERYHVDASAGFGRQNVKVQFKESEVFARVSDFYKSKGVV